MLLLGFSAGNAMSHWEQFAGDSARDEGMFRDFGI
jgi:hypothetical protein